MWLRFDTRTEGGKNYGQLILTNPDTLDDYFIVEKWFDYTWAGVSDHNTWYPLFNALVDYIDANSTTWPASKQTTQNLKASEQREFANTLD